MITIGIDQYLSNSAMCEHICMENIKKVYKYYRNFDDQWQYKAVIEEATVSTPEVFTENRTILDSQYVTVKSPSARKSLRHFLETLEVKPKTSVCRFCAAKSKHKEIRPVSMLCSSIQKRQRYSKINQQVKNLFTIVFYNIVRLWYLQ